MHPKPLTCANVPKRNVTCRSDWSLVHVVSRYLAACAQPEGEI